MSTPGEGKYVLLDRETQRVILYFGMPAADFSTERAATLLALQCAVKHKDPGDFILAALVDEKIITAVYTQVDKLLEGVRIGNTVLTRREKEIIDALRRDGTVANKEMAAQLHVSERTIKFHVSSLLAKYGVKNRVDLARIFSRVGVIK